MRLNPKRKAYYFTPFDILRPRTNQISDVRFCEGLVQNGFEVTLIAPYVYRKDNLDKKKVLDFYGVEDKYKIVYLPTLFTADIEGYWRMALISLLNTIYFLFLRIKSLFKPRTEVYLFSRSPFLLLPIIWLKKLSLFKAKITIWLHEIKINELYKHVLANADYLLGTNSQILKDIENKFPRRPTKLGLSLNPVSEAQLKNVPDKKLAKEKIKAGDQALAVYTGKLFIGQLEAEFILKAAEALPQYQFLFTGGKPNVIDYYSRICMDKGMSNVRFTGYINDYRDLIYYQAAADLLISYYTEKEHDVRYNFPQKIVEYMLCGGPIVSPNFPATQDVLNPNNCIFVEPCNEKSLINGIKEGMEGQNRFQLAQTAQIEAKNYTFKKQIAKTIINDLV